jgi:hypothetical protein
MTDIPRDRHDRWGLGVLPVLPVTAPTVIARLWAQAPLDAAGCFVWTGVKDRKGYGRLKVDGKGYSTHRIAWAWFNGVEIPDGMTVDHLCLVKVCCNPIHLNICSSGENSRRSPHVRASINKAKTHCPSGHAYMGANLRVDKKGHRVCIACADRHKRAYRARQKESVAA